MTLLALAMGAMLLDLVAGYDTRNNRLPIFAGVILKHKPDVIGKDFALIGGVPQTGPPSPANLAGLDDGDEPLDDDARAVVAPEGRASFFSHAGSLSKPAYHRTVRLNAPVELAEVEGQHEQPG